MSKEITMIKLLIAGSRDFHDYDVVKKEFDKLGKDAEIISGCAMGADTLAIRLAKELELVVHTFPANWTKYGKGAGFVRNKDMVDLCDEALIFWNGKSKGTEHTICLLMDNKKSFTLRMTKEIIDDTESETN